MGKRGPKPKGKVRLTWSPAFAYAIGLIVSDGNLSPDGRHIHFTSKDKELIEHFIAALGIPNQFIGRKARYQETDKRYFVVQFGDVLFYRFLLEIGLMPNKSRRLGRLNIPDELFPHFFRGLFDGDGSFFSYWDKRWRSSFMYYTSICSASAAFLLWLQQTTARLWAIRGYISRSKTSNTQQLMYAKKATNILVPHMYEKTEGLFLTRKHLKISEALAIVSGH